MKQIIILLVVSFLIIQAESFAKPSVSKISTNTNINNLRKMGAVVAFNRRPDGSYCQVDVRGNTKLTPSFVKPSGGYSPLPKNNISVCSFQERKILQKTTKKFNIQGARVQKTSAGALLGSLAKSAGVGCVFGMGIAWLFGNNSNEQKTEATALCVECSTDKAGEDTDLKKELALLGGNIVGGTVIAGATSVTPIDKTLPALNKNGILALKQFIKSVAKPPSAVLGGGISGAILCGDGTTYLLKSNPKTNL